MNLPHFVKGCMLFISGCLFVATVSAKTNEYNESPLQVTISNKDANIPLTEAVHVYVVKVTNKSTQAVIFRLQASNVNCSNHNNPVDFSQEIISEENTTGTVSNTSSKTILPPNGTVEFTLRLIRPLNTALNSWNCTQLKAIGITNNLVSNETIVESFIPDPKDFR